jgi:serine/threonine protein kinase
VAVAVADGAAQSRFYRAPEVLLGSQWGRAIDVWSFGCLLAELALGKPIFSGGSEFDQLHQIVRLLGPVPAEMLQRGVRAIKYFEVSGTPSRGQKYVWRMLPAVQCKMGRV